MVTLVHASHAILDQDIRRIRNLERNGLYNFERERSMHGKDRSSFARTHQDETVAEEDLVPEFACAH